MAGSVHKFHDAAVRPPKGGWHFTIAGQLVKRYSETDIIEEVMRWRRNNGTFVSRIDVERELWAYWCSREPHRCNSTSPSTSGSRVSTEEVKAFASMATKAILSGKPFESQDEAERRAAICVQCPMNQPLPDCETCRKAVGVLINTLGRRHTSQDENLKVCAVCGCELKSAVHVNLEAQQSIVSPEINARFPSFCWKKKP